MILHLLDSVSLPGHPAKPNEDSFAFDPMGAVVMDGATGLGENLMPGPSDAAWVAQFGARRLLAHVKDGDAPKPALRRVLAETQKSFEALRRRAPREVYETPFAAMMLVAANDAGFQALWFGDCAAIIKTPDGAVTLLGEALDKRKAEAARAATHLAEARPASGDIDRASFLPALRAARNRMNSRNGSWAFGPDTRAAAHAGAKRVAAGPGTLLLLATDGFLALASDYGAYDMAGLIAAAETRGLAALASQARTIEEGDPQGARYPRFKKSDDCTALLLRLTDAQEHPGFHDKSWSPQRRAL